MSEQLHSELVDQPHEVDVVRIEQELSQLWQQAAATSDGEQSHMLVRACSMNLLVVTKDDGELQTLGDTVAELTIEHPSRSLLVCADRVSHAAGLDAWVSVRCVLRPGGREAGEAESKQVCCEQVTLKALGADTSKLPGIIMSLLVPDVPTVLVWKGEADLHDELLQTLVKICDRCLIDSSEDLNPEGRLKSWKNLFGLPPRRVAFGDLAWKHIGPWRNLLAETFQPMSLREHLRSIDHLGLQYSVRAFPSHSGLSQSLLFVGWLANALHWTKAEPLRRLAAGGYRGVVQSGTRMIQIDVSPLDDDVQRPGEIEGVMIRSTEGLQCSLLTTESRHCVRQALQLRADIAPERMISVRMQTETELLSGELEALSPDELYEKSVTSLIDLMESQV